MKTFRAVLLIVSTIASQQLQIQADENLNDWVDDKTPTYFVSLEVRETSSQPWIYKCSGALITPHNVVTAAGCFFNITLCQSRFIHNNAIHYLDALYIHPRYSGFHRHSYDVAVAKVKTPFDVDKDSLPKPGPIQQRSVRRIGWQDPSSDNRQLLDQLESITKCGQSVAETLICTDTPKKPCDDDMGSPLVTISKPLKLVGILSRYLGCGLSNESKEVSYVEYTKISSVIDFIKDAIRGKLHVFGLY